MFVDFDSGLAACINQVRVALGDRAASPRFVETLPRQGYRFIADVRSEARAQLSGRAAPVAEPTPATPARRRLALAAAATLAAAAAAIGAFALGTLMASRRSPPALPPVPSVVVLPIPTPAGDTALAAIARDGISSPPPVPGTVRNRCRRR